MHIDQLSLINFKNYQEISIPLHKKVNCFVGNNGEGKTNLLDSVYYLCMCKSYFQSSDEYSIRKNTEFMVLQARFNSMGDENEIYCGLKAGKRKIFRKNKKEYPKLSDHVGQYPVVMVSPSDSALILDGSEERRRYINAVISQYDREYLEAIMHYNKVLTQRNRLLKEMRVHTGSKDLLEVYNNQIVPLGSLINKQRKEFVDKLSPVFKQFYKLISEGKESVDINYISKLNDKDFGDLLVDHQHKDLMSQYTTVGIHKDDLELIMDGTPIKKTGSQGQQKTFLVALKLAQFSFLKEIRGIPPLLLLDDIFDKFDLGRVRQILHLVADKSFGQIFITHTNEERMKKLLEEFENNYYLYKVEAGNINKIES